MRLDLYQKETQQLALLQTAMLKEAKEKLQTGQNLSLLEQSGVLHALQVLIENAIGKAKHILKASNELVPVSAYDTFANLVHLGVLPANELPKWNAVLGIRNRIVHDYMNLDMAVIFDVVINQRYGFVADFLFQPLDMIGKS
ncbi:MAG: hypothetical protein CTY29_02435 [Methylobacter sp.]|nr:MAG: hypothetical protein CTY29_02435 [Methylobacter sp.]